LFKLLFLSDVFLLSYKTFHLQIFNPIIVWLRFLLKSRGYKETKVLLIGAVHQFYFIFMFIYIYIYIYIYWHVVDSKMLVSEYGRSKEYPAGFVYSIQIENNKHLTYKSQKCECVCIQMHWTRERFNVLEYIYTFVWRWFIASCIW